MSSWTYVRGQVTVSPGGNGPHAQRFVIEEVLEHLPRVTGSEGPMEWTVVQVGGPNGSSSSDEFGIQTNLRGEHGWWRENDEYVIVLRGDLRDREFGQTLREFSKWLFRLAGRVWVRGLLVKVVGYGRSQLFDVAEPLSELYFSRLAEGREGVRRASSNWRYEIMPDNTYWPHSLVNLVPGGNTLARERDAMLGLLEPEEYLKWNGKAGRYVGVDQELRKRLLDGKADLDAVLAWLDEQDEKYRE